MPSPRRSSLPVALCSRSLFSRRSFASLRFTIRCLCLFRPLARSSADALPLPLRPSRASSRRGSSRPLTRPSRPACASPCERRAPVPNYFGRRRCSKHAVSLSVLQCLFVLLLLATPSTMIARIAAVFLLAASASACRQHDPRSFVDRPDTELELAKLRARYPEINAHVLGGDAEFERVRLARQASKTRPRRRAATQPGYVATPTVPLTGAPGPLACVGPRPTFLTD